MNVQVEVISKEIIKPSSPTPNPLRHYKLPFLDQLTPPSYTSLVFFYEFNGETQPAINEVSKHLKKSLAKGIAYLEAQVTNCRLCDFLNNPLPDELNKFIPFAQDGHIANEIALGVQLNMFEGGFAIGLCTSHKLADLLCMLMFTKTWAAIARDEVEIQRPQFVSATLFPPKGITCYNWGAGITTKKVTKRFVFDASTIEDLREKYTGLQNNEKQPSPVEALSAFMWRRFVGATKDDHDDKNKLHSLIHSVDLRPLIDPPLSPYSFGNIYGNSLTAPFLSSGDDDDGDQESSYGMVRRVQEAISKIDKDFVKRLQHGDEQLSLIGRPACSKC
ncbi:vinorine synthase-like [Prunus yedoensis var. nudiflora]|uniref:Vinorine synthase-like n=1 Tax=Prunus yedoensis var. nudiflora TaxID=2094558 RepID=A0A314Z8C9_PRUYE|nr:vinorine synthase-like [Prunus yedoensis var. nudiflora]